jgi:hypothetical protein
MATGAFVSSFVLARHTGLDAGFDTYDDVLGVRERMPSILRDRFSPTAERRGDRTVAGRDRLAGRRHDAGRFVWIHLYDPHAPYDPPPPWDARYDCDAQRRARQSGAGARIHGGPRAGRISRCPRTCVPAVARYAGEISWTDAVVGTLVAALPSDATIVVVADHGESLVEHGEFLGHGRTLYEPSLRVFAIAGGPGIARSVVEDPSRSTRSGGALVPLATTGAGLPAPGRDPIWAFTYGERSEASVDPDPGPRFAEYDGPTNGSWTVAGPRTHSSGARTPGETHDIASEDPTAAAIVVEASKELRARLEGARAPDSGVRALGYTE